jgi:GR25 family glycosyltransferase involved in LPS biosynthesis
MKVGVTTHVQFSLFSGGTGGTSLAVAEVFRNLGDEVWLLNTNGDSEWWDDCKSMRSTWKDFMVNGLTIREGKLPGDGKPFDLIVEVDRTFFMSAAERSRASMHCVWLHRKSAVFHDIEASLYPFDMAKRCVDGLSAVWMFDVTTTEDDKNYLETVARCPVYRVPFTWTPSYVEVHRGEVKAPEWLQVTEALGPDKPWSVHICETNNSAASSLTLPLVILHHTKEKTSFPFVKWIAHNADQVQKSDFFKNNVKAHCEIKDLSGEFIGRQRLIDWVYDAKSCVLTHMRFTPLRPFLLDAVWTGMPMIHNSPWIRDLVGTGYEQLYYPDNQIIAASACFERLEADFRSRSGIFSAAARTVTRQMILEKVSPYSLSVCNAWRAAFQALKAPTSTATVPLPVAAPAPLPVPAPVAPTTKVVNILFTDMWDDFNPSYNMFTLMLNEAGRHLTPPVRVDGYGPGDKRKPDICMFGPFGSQWTQLEKEIPKIHYSGENSMIISREDVKLNIGFQHTDFKDQDYLRLPLWMLEIDWFGCDKEKIANPKPISIDSCTQVGSTATRKKFCAFVVTNPCNPVRNSAFHWLSKYKQVDSAGRLFNNVGDVIFAGRGGGGGELKKFEFLRDYKFCLAYENSSSQGYTTEKFLHAKAAGCIPIYWGDPKVDRDFDSAGFIDARGFTTPEELINAVRKMDTDDNAWLKAVSVPALDDTRRDLVRRTLSECARRILRLGLGSDAGLDAIPRFIGATSDSSQAIISKPIQKEIKDVVVVTAATLRFLPSLHQLLVSINAQKQNTSSLSIEGEVWLGDDVEESTEKELSKEFSWVKFNRFPKDASASFPDLWEPKHFAWKLWIYQYMVNRVDHAGKLCMYIDSGIFMCRWPVDWMQIARNEGICLINDTHQINKHWCHEEFCKELAVTDTEKKENQVLGGICAFVAGHTAPVKLFTDAWKLGQKRELIVGPKWEGIGTDGKLFGHRHDQSILSILSSRQGLPRYPIDLVYCDESLRRTFLGKKAFYVHRGSFTVHKPFSTSIDDCYVINLDRRGDRMEKLYANMPTLAGRVQRTSAVEGKTLQMSPAIARLFRPHDFKWKKPVLGCALSHLRLWWQLAQERDDINNYLILEDDVKMSPDWEARWKAAAPHLPENFDIVYLGGILPPNREGFESAKEKVNDHFSKVKENTFFGQTKPNRYFHWCAYSYVLSKQGARKVIEILMAKDGYWTSADHMLCNPVEFLNMYFLDPLVAGCYQDDDPRYQASAFNDFSRTDAFDSDLWNNTEHFNTVDCESMSRMDVPIDIPRALLDSLVVGKETPEVVKEKVQPLLDAHPLWRQLHSATRLREPLLAREIAFQMMKAWEPEWCEKTDEEFAPFIESVRANSFAGLPSKDELTELYKQWTILTDAAAQAGKLWPTHVKICLEVFLNYLPCATPPPKIKGRRILKLKEQGIDLNLLYEGKWLKEIFGEAQDLRTDDISIGDALPKDEPILFVMKPFWSMWMPIIRRLAETNTKFYVIHLSDEFLSDPIEFYGLSQCLGIVRMYWRDDLEVYGDKVTVIPLGYHWTKNSGIKNPLADTPRLPFRELTWSFAGTDWRGRQEAMKNLTLIKPNSVRWFTEWNDPGMLKEDEYLNVLLNSRFVPIPAGNNHETYRLYEALECGCIPVYIRQPGDELFFNKHLKPWLPIVDLPSWDHAAALMFQLSSTLDVMEQYRNGILDGYGRWKLDVAKKVRSTLRI